MMPYYGYGYGYGYSGNGLSTILYFAIIIMFFVSMYYQLKVSSTFSKYSKIQNSKGITGADVAREIGRAHV